MANMKYNVIIHTPSDEEAYRIGEKIHQQLVGNQDYIDSSIVLNCTSGDGNVYLTIWDDCKGEIPQINIF